MISQSEDTARRHSALLNEIARRAICGDDASRPLENMPTAFSRAVASFVTLHKAGKLRGCCGSVMARRPLLEDIRANAFRSAFGDPRFDPLERTEWQEVSLSVTLLSPLQPMTFESEIDLLSQLRPHRDGLLIEDAGRGALFLPAVWEAVTNKQEFLAHLKVKAGLSPDHWSTNFRASSFWTTHTLEESLLHDTSEVEIEFA